MPIRRSLYTPPPPPPPPPDPGTVYCELFGELASPPLMGYPINWPNGSILLSRRIIRHLGKPVVIGWTSPLMRGLNPTRTALNYGAWYATKFGYHNSVRPYGHEYVGLDPMRDYDYVGQFDGFPDAMEAIKSAFEEKHSIYFQP